MDGTQGLKEGNDGFVTENDFWNCKSKKEDGRCERKMAGKMAGQCGKMGGTMKDE
jgi:hypothetical protein